MQTSPTENAVWDVIHRQQEMLLYLDNRVVLEGKCTCTKRCLPRAGTLMQEINCAEEQVMDQNCAMETQEASLVARIAAVCTATAGRSRCFSPRRKFYLLEPTHLQAPCDHKQQRKGKETMLDLVSSRHQQGDAAKQCSMNSISFSLLTLLFEIKLR